MEEQGLFLKAASALVGPSEGVALRFAERRTDHEAELGVVIGRAGSDIAYPDAMDHVAGYGIAMDMVVRGPEDRSFRKSVDSYAVFGPWLATADEIPDPGNLDFGLSVGGEVHQKNNTSNLILDLPGQIAWASRFYTLHPGDIIMSGTCAGRSRLIGKGSSGVHRAEIDRADYRIRPAPPRQCARRARRASQAPAHPR